MSQGEWLHFRFFLPEEYYCRPALVIVRPFYGSVSMSLSTSNPNIDFSVLGGWKQVPPLSYHF